MSDSSGLSRMVKLYQMLERVRGRELGAASLAVDEVRVLRESAVQGRLADGAAARRGLAAGSWVEAAATLAGREAAEVQRRALIHLHTVRTDNFVVARGTHQTSRTELRQVETLLASARRAALQEEERRSQSTSDDRYLSRREWMRKRAPRGQV